MPIPTQHQNERSTTPTAASDEEKAAMGRALTHEAAVDLYKRLEQENTASRDKASPDRRSTRR